VTGPLAQLGALLALRWQMARAPGTRLGVVVGVAFVLELLVLVLGSGRHVDAVTLATAIELAPAAYLGFAGLAVLAPLAAGGGHDVVPPDQLTPFPVRPATQFLGGLLLAPLNLVWVVQLLGLAALTAWLTLDGPLLLGALTTGAYVAAATVLGQDLAWLVAGLRATRRGRRGVTLAGAALALATVVLVRSGRADEAVAASPTHAVVSGVIAGADGHLAQWAAPSAALVLVAAAGALAGTRTCGWALHRPRDDGGHAGPGPLRRRPAKAGPLRELVAVDRASVWRAPALRRGAVVLAVLPGLLAAGAAVPWSSLIVLPGLVAAAAALLFGVNAFALDASGALWLASLPHDPALALRAKALVVGETVLAAVVGAVVAASLRSPGAPTAAEVTAILSAVVLSPAVVVTLALAASVRRPHRAELLGPRDAVAPPGALAVASLRMALPAAGIGVLLSAASATGVAWLPPVLALPPLLLCLLSATRTLRRWTDPLRRAQVVAVVSGG
jgi:hypothetical protein